MRAHHKDPQHRNHDLAAEVEAYEFAFADALAAQGYGEHLIPADGQWHNFAFPDSKRGKKNGGVKLTFGGDGVVIDRRKHVKKPNFIWRGTKVELTYAQRADLQRDNAARAATQKAK